MSNSYALPDRTEVIVADGPNKDIVSDQIKIGNPFNAITFGVVWTIGGATSVEWTLLGQDAGGFRQVAFGALAAGVRTNVIGNFTSIDDDTVVAALGDGGFFSEPMTVMEGEYKVMAKVTGTATTSALIMFPVLGRI